MTTTLITGANKGLGFETARQLIAAGHTVYIGSRDAERGRLASHRLGARSVLLDVTDDGSVTAAAKTIEADGGLDVLVNNAGIEEYGPDGRVIGAAGVTADGMRTLFETNVFGVVRVTHAFLPLLERSAAPVVVNLSSGLASMARVTDPGAPGYAYPGVAYPASKAAVNMITVQYAKAFPSIRINAVEPGYTATDLNRHAGTQTVEQGAEIIVRMAQAGPDGPTGGYFDAAAPFPGNRGGNDRQRTATARTCRGPVLAILGP
jgi:NAD(P)-dependent dehydrogenase (short-subunit alcohol dehydrogenase family)